MQNINKKKEFQEMGNARMMQFFLLQIYALFLCCSLHDWLAMKFAINEARDRSSDGAHCFLYQLVHHTIMH